MKAVANAKAAGPDGLPVELLKLRLQQDRSSTDLPPSSGAREKSHSDGKTRSLPYSTRRTTTQSAETTAASRSCHTRASCSFKWLPGDFCEAKGLLPEEQ